MPKIYNENDDDKKDTVSLSTCLENRFWQLEHSYGFSPKNDFTKKSQSLFT